MAARFNTVVGNIICAIIYIMKSILAVLLVAAVTCGAYYLRAFFNGCPELEQRICLEKQIEAEHPDGFRSLEEWHSDDYLDAPEFDRQHGIDGRELSFEGNTFILTFNLPETGYSEDACKKHFDQYNRGKAVDLHCKSMINDITVRYVYKDCHGDIIASFEKTYHFDDDEER